MKRHIAIIGGGPVGLEAALAASERGHEVTLLEAARPGAHVRAWSHVRFFTPWSMNVGERGGRIARIDAQSRDLCPTGAEYVARVLEPLHAHLGQRVDVRLGARVVGVSRRGVLKGDLHGRLERAAHPFRLLVDKGGEERALEADVVFDCSGVYGNPNCLGDGGLPAPGERAAAEHIEYRIPDLAGVDRARYVGRRVLLMGGGTSAMTSALLLAELVKEEPRTKVHWATRSPHPPLPTPLDPLAERAALLRAAERLSRHGAGLVFHNGVVIDRIRRASDGLVVELRPVGSPEVQELVVDRVIANVGYRIDEAMTRELQVELCPVDGGPRAIAEALRQRSVAAAERIPTDEAHADRLRTGEPNYFILGAKSHGRRADFLLREGFAQVEEVFTLLGY